MTSGFFFDLSFLVSDMFVCVEAVLDDDVLFTLLVVVDDCGGKDRLSARLNRC